jgi:hypothetical protein
MVDSSNSKVYAICYWVETGAYINMHNFIMGVVISLNEKLFFFYLHAVGDKLIE